MLEPNRGQLNIKIPTFTLNQLDQLLGSTGMTKTQVVILAIERLHHTLVKDSPQSLSPLRESEETTLHE